jgi:hypothetical protein
MSNKPARPTELPEPFLLLKSTKPGHPVSNEDLSEQIGAVSAHLCVVHREAALARAEATDAKDAANGAHDAIEELRSLVLGDHAPRISKVEEKAEEVAHSTRRLSISPKVKRGAAQVGIAGALVSLVPVIQQLWPLIEKALAK